MASICAWESTSWDSSCPEMLHWRSGTSGDYEWHKLLAFQSFLMCKSGKLDQREWLWSQALSLMG